MGDYRKGVDYRDGGEIEIDDLGKPLSLLDSWISEAKEKGLVEPNAMSISTVSSSGSPRSRMVLLKLVEGDEIGFFTNLESDKSLEIAGCDSVAVTMWWPEMERQVRIEAHRVSDGEIASRGVPPQQVQEEQNRRMGLRTESGDGLEGRPEKEVPGVRVEVRGGRGPPPSSLGGIRITVNRGEYWSGRPSRLHERIVLERESETWSQKRLYP